MINYKDADFRLATKVQQIDPFQKICPDVKCGYKMPLVYVTTALERFYTLGVRA